MLTCNGTVEVNDLKISTSNGDLVRFLEYRPKTATADNTVPAIVYSPGNDSTAESVRLCSSELARRGYAVYVLDLLSAGHSSEGVGNSPTFGFEELIDYVYSNLDYVDNAHIGIAGYSKGGGNVIRVMTTLGDQQREDPDNYVRKVDAAWILAPPFQPLDALATGINLGFGAGLYDPYSRIGFKPVEGYWPGDLSVKREMKETINLGVPGTFAEDELDDPNVKVEIGHVYGSFAENNARVVYNPADSTHGSGMISRGFMLIGIRYSVCDLYDIAQFFVYAVSPLLKHGYYKGINYICNANDRLSCSLIKDCAGIPVYAVDLNAGPKLNVYYLPHQQL